jgi:hypothetical protein
MRKIKVLLLTFCFAVNFFACENVDFGDMNVNKNGSVEPSTAGLLAGAIMSWGTFTNRTGVTIPTLYVQYQSQVTYTDEMQYAETPYSWATYYDNILQPLNMIINIVDDPENATDAALLKNGSLNNQKGVALILRSMVMKRLTDIYGDVPFSEANKGLDELTPAYDTQQDIYNQIIADVKAGRNMLDATQTAVAGDLFYNGSPTAWKRLANSFLLQTTIQLSNRYPNAGQMAATEFAAALADPAGVIETVAQEAWFPFQNLAGFRNPWFANRTADYFMSAEFINSMNGCGPGGTACPAVALSTGGAVINTVNPTTARVADPRKLVYVRHDHQTRNGVPYGYRSGSGSSRAQMATRYYWSPTSKLPLMTAAYTFLNRAEAMERGWTTAATDPSATFDTPVALFQQGLTMSFASLQNKANVESAALTTPVTPPVVDGTTYIAARVAQYGAVPPLQIIAEEKWKALFGQAFDAWSEWRRTGFPALVPAADYVNSGAIPSRFLYPNEEPALNESNYDAAIARQGADQNTTDIWWMQ